MTSVSIAVTTNNLQDISPASLPPADNHVADPRQDDQPATLFNKYGYDEFIGYAGKRLLDRILQEILTHANWRTWHFADEFVAPGSDCYVGPYRLAQQIRPGVRKVEMDFKSLRELGLMEVYPDYRMVKQAATGKVVMQAVIIKDFAKLYALAHEYHVWEGSPEYIPPERQYLSLILTDEALTQKLLRFDNYRRVIACHKPGRKPGQAEPPMSHAAIVALAAGDVQGEISGTETKEFSNTLAKTLSPNREIRISQGELNQSGSSRSGLAAELGEKSVAVATIRNEYTASTIGTNGDNQRNFSISNTNIPSPLEETRAAPLAEDAEQPKSKRKKHTEGEKPSQPLPGYLLEVILKPLSVYFCDQSPASSETSLAWLFAEFSQRGMDEYNEYFLELINDARDITNLKMRQGQIRGRNGDGSVAQMPYFFSVLETNVYAWCKRYDEVMQDLNAQEPQHEEEAPRGDTGEEYYDQWLTEQYDESFQGGDQQQASTSMPSEESTLPPVSSDEHKEEDQPLALPVVSTSESAPDRKIVGFIDTDSPNDGWRHARTADYADRLQIYLGRDRFQCAILPTCCHGHYGIVLVERQTGSEEVFVRDWEVENRIQQHMRP